MLESLLPVLYKTPLKPTAYTVKVSPVASFTDRFDNRTFTSSPWFEKIHSCCSFHDQDRSLITLRRKRESPIQIKYYPHYDSVRIRETYSGLRTHLTRKRRQNHYGKSASLIRTVRKWFQNVRRSHMSTNNALDLEGWGCVRLLVMWSPRVNRYNIQKVSSRWVQRLLTFDEARDHVTGFKDGLQRFQWNPDNFRNLWKKIGYIR